MQPDTWDELKHAMCDQFVPASYKCNLHNKLQNLEKGDMFIHESYAELQKEYGFLWGSR
jgi:hypothetical protein